MLKHLGQAHYFFCRQSQHYVLGNWAEFTPWNWQKVRYKLYFPWAYAKFMGYAVYDGLRGYRYGPY